MSGALVEFLSPLRSSLHVRCVHSVYLMSCVFTYARVCVTSCARARAYPPRGETRSYLLNTVRTRISSRISLYGPHRVNPQPLPPPFVLQFTSSRFPFPRHPSFPSARTRCPASFYPYYKSDYINNYLSITLCYNFGFPFFNADDSTRLHVLDNTRTRLH